MGNELGSACNMEDKARNTCDALDGISARKRELGRQRLEWEVNTKSNLKKNKVCD
jgi:hypothetical protein